MAILSHSQNTLHLKCNSVDLTVENSIVRQTVVFLEQACSQFIKSDEYFAIMFGKCLEIRHPKVSVLSLLRGMIFPSSFTFGCFHLIEGDYYKILI